MEYLIIALFFGLIGWAIGKGKGRATEGFLWGAVLGIIGIIIIVVRKPAWECPICRTTLESAFAPCRTCMTAVQNAAILAAAQKIIDSQTKISLNKETVL